MSHIGIDATNLRQGGGITHLAELLTNFDPESSQIDKITVWCNSYVASRLPSKKWLIVRSDKWIDGSRLMRFVGQQFFLSRLMQLARCDICFSPGGVIPLLMRLPAITMSQNMLPFDLSQARLFGWFNPVFWKLLLLRFVQATSFKRAAGLIFLSEYAQTSIGKVLKLKPQKILIPHGIDLRFSRAPDGQKLNTQYSFAKPFKFIYVSILMPYKHQIEVAKAIHLVRQKGIPVMCQFIGPAWGWYERAFQRQIKILDSDGEFLNYAGEVDYGKLEDVYHGADGFIFASSCENLPNILIEAMSAGLPIACSKISPMVEVLGKAGYYFKPSDPYSIAEAISEMVNDPKKRLSNARLAFEYSAQFSWAKCSQDTFKFIDNILSQINAR
jgi:glycosyltransferase involved in cell wall biosynthesis